LTVERLNCRNQAGFLELELGEFIRN